MNLNPFLETFSRAALGLVLFSLTSFAQANDCAAQNELTWVKATYALSGDSLVIQDGKFKLIGIYAPQIPRTQKFNTPGQPLAKEAQLFLNKLLANNDMEVGVEYDTTKIDKFNRQLAHLFLKDGTNVQQKMIESGYAVAFTTEGNTLHQNCYFQAEKTARDNQYQLWDLAAKNPNLHFPIVNSSDIRKQDDGFRIVRGKVEMVDKSSNNFIINLDTTGIRVPKQNWENFDYNQIKSLDGKEIEARGITYFYKGAMFMVIDHPNAINLFNPLNRPTQN